MKSKITFFIIFLFFVHLAHAQQKRQLSIDLGRSFHGTGDMTGAGFAVEYGKYIHKKVEITTALGANVHHSQFPAMLNPRGSGTDTFVRFVTAGMQLYGQINYAILRTKKHELKVGGGILIRYQASSLPDSYIVYSPILTGVPETLVGFKYLEKMEIVTVGYIGSVSYNYMITPKYFIGAKASFQNDSNADLVTQYGIRLGQRL